MHYETCIVSLNIPVLRICERIQLHGTSRLQEHLKTSYAPYRNIRNFWLKTEISITSDLFFICKSMGISDFERWSLNWWPYKSNSCNKNCILVFWSKWHGHISRFQFRNRFKMTKTQICSENSDQCPLSNSESSQHVKKLLTSMGFAIVILGGSEITDWKNQFKLV